eukprot:TRINITY_DN6123_c0_g1_i1.p1 TRINITY_DN6123_c0_g1~~TRINITY_DN6123_c0_g1_i1.p1  ORF type:complete len:152 (+),score=13.95 TRINITY_DN6123_c0_g1_i1:24-479(+)
MLHDAKKGEGGWWSESVCEGTQVTEPNESKKMEKIICKIGGSLFRKSKTVDCGKPVFRCQPSNECCGDKFDMTTDGSKLTVTRIGGNDWGQELEASCDTPDTGPIAPARGIWSAEYLCEGDRYSDYEFQYIRGTRDALKERCATACDLDLE